MLSKIALFLYFISISFLSAQSQYGLAAGVNKMSLNSDDLQYEPGIGYEIGVQNIAGLHRTGDLISEITYSTNSTNIQGNLTENGLIENQQPNSIKFSIQNINVNILYNHYLVVPDGYSPHIAIQGGLSVSILNQWKSKETISDYNFGDSRYRIADFGNLSPLNAGWIVGIGSGFEQLRINLRYYKSLSNPLKRTIGSGENFEDMAAKPNYLSLSIVYFFDKFY